MGFLSKHEMQPILLLQFHEWNGISNDLQNNVGQDLFVDIKNGLVHEKWMLHIRMEPSGWKRGAENYIIIIIHF